MSISRIKIVAGVSLAAIAAWGGVVWYNSGEPNRVARRFIQALNAKDWKSLLEVTSEEEKLANGWTPATFSTFAGTMTSHLSSSIEESSLFEKDPGQAGPTVREGALEVRRQQMWDQHSTRKFGVKARDGIEVDGKTPSLQLEVLRDQQGSWRVCTGSILVLLNRCNRSKSHESAENLKVALNKAGLPYFCEFRSNAIIRAERIDSFLNGEISNMDLWESMPKANPRR